MTNRDWTHFWLNEGLATFMAAAYKERARGRDACLADVEAWRTRGERLRAAGTDNALVLHEQAGQSVRSTDLQHAFEASRGRDLGPFFNERVYGR